MNKGIVYLSFFLLITANFISIAWIWNEGGFEPVITSILIFTAIIGFFVERWISTRARRKELLHALIHELFINSGVLNDPDVKGIEPERTKIFTRLSNSMVDSCLASGCFMEKKDGKLLKLLYDWKIFTEQYNTRLGATEQATILNPTPTNIALWNNKLATGKTIRQVKEKLSELGAHLLDNYSHESGITDDTILFE